MTRNFSKIKKPENVFQKWFYYEMIKNDLSMDDIAKKLCLTRPTISRIYNREFKLTFLHIVGFCYVFGCNDPEMVWEMIKDKAE